MDNNTKLYAFTNKQLQALVVFLNRVDYHGLPEAEMAMSIKEVLMCPYEPPLKKQEG